MDAKQKLWGGRFEKPTNKAVEDFHSSIRFDCRLYRQDIEGSIAHATMLGEQKIIPAEDAALIVEGLQGILADIEAGKVEFDVSAEDIHMNVEKLLTERIGPAGGRLHTGRSRNDQVALDGRMYVRDACAETMQHLKELEALLIRLASAHTRTIMPGYTHLQKAQPITLAFQLMAYFEMFQRDRERFGDCRRRANVMPLGSGALAGTTYPLNRERVAELLDFPTITRNALDGVSDRDWAIEYVSCAATAMMHLTRFCEELILYSSHEFRFVTMDDGYSTGSSIMPQKKNPDVAELIRGKSGRVYGHLTGLLTTMKSLPLAYNKDMQEDKEALFDTHDTLTGCLTLFTAMLSTVTFHEDVMRSGAAGGFTNATDAADYLVKKGLPFRQAHEVIGKMVLHCVHSGQALHELTLDELSGFCPLIEADFYDAIDLMRCVNDRRLPGGPAEEAVLAHIEQAKALLEDDLL